MLSRQDSKLDKCIVTNIVNSVKNEVNIHNDNIFFLNVYINKNFIC